MSDCLPSSPLVYTHADLVHYGYIIVKDTESKHGKDFHRNYTIDDFPTAPMFNSLKEAVEELPAYDGETFVMAFEQNTGECDRLWFSKEQKEAGILERLNRYRSCYGGYGTAIFNG